MKTYALIVLLFLLFSNDAWAQSLKPASIAELATYTGADREQLLYAGAKSEGTVTWYTSLAGDSYKAMARAFEAKYPGVRVESYRAGGSELVVRMAEETKARRPTFDALETTYDFMMVSRASSLTRPYNSPVLANTLPKPRKRLTTDLPFGPSFASPTWASVTTKSKFLPARCPRDSMVCFIHSSKGKWGLRSTKVRRA